MHEITLKFSEAQILQWHRDVFPKKKIDILDRAIADLEQESRKSDWHPMITYISGEPLK